MTDDLPPLLPGANLEPARLAAIETLASYFEGRLQAAPLTNAGILEGLALRHLAKAVGSTGSALALIRQGRRVDACVLVRAIFEQLFAFLWVAQDPQKAHVRATMVTIKQEWANAKYLEGLLPLAPDDTRDELVAEAAAYKARADALLADVAGQLGTTEKKVRDEAKLRVSAKAVEVNLGPAFTVPYAYYSGYVHTDGNALDAFAVETPAGLAFDVRGTLPERLPLAADLHRVLLRMAEEAIARSPAFARPGDHAVLARHAAWLAEAARVGDRGR